MSQTFFLCTQSREEEATPGSRLWRKALGEVRSAAQLSLCIQQLQKSISWERAIMKVVSDHRFVQTAVSFKECFRQKKRISLSRSILSQFFKAAL